MPYQPKGPLLELPAGHPCEHCAIRPITICRRLEATTLARLRALGTMQRVGRDEPVFHEGDPADRVFMLAAGCLKIYTLLADGRRQITGFMFPGDFLGMSVDDEYPFTVEALELSELWWFTRHSFERFVDENPSIERELHWLVVHELAAAQKQIVLLGRKAAAERLASFFLVLLDRRALVAGQPVTEFDLPMSRTDIADYLGLTKETVSRMIATLRNRRLVRLVKQNRIEVLDRKALEAVAAGFDEH